MSTPVFRNPLMPRSILRETRAPNASVEPPSAPTPPVPPTIPPTMSEADAARYINVSVGWLRKSRCTQFREAMDGPTFVRLGARRVTYLRADLDAWLGNHRQQLARHNINSAEREASTVVKRDDNAGP